MAIRPPRTDDAATFASPSESLPDDWMEELCRLAPRWSEGPVLSVSTLARPASFAELGIVRLVVVPLALPPCRTGLLLFGFRCLGIPDEDELAVYSLLGEDLGSILELTAFDDRLLAANESRDRLVSDLHREREHLQVLISELQQARTFERRRAEQLKEVNRLGTLLTSELDLPTLLQKTAEAVRAVVAAEYAALILPGSTEGSYAVAGLAGTDRPAPARAPAEGTPSPAGDPDVDAAAPGARGGLPASAPVHGTLDGVASPSRNGLLDLILRDGQTIFVSDVALHERLQELVPRQRSLLGVPLRLGDRRLGALILGHSEPGRFARQDLELVSTLASQASIAIENARLVSEHARRTLELQTIIDQMAEAVWVSDQHARIGLINQTALSVYGFGPSERKPETLAELSARVQLTQEDGTPWPLESLLQRAAQTGESVMGAQPQVFDPASKKTRSIFVNSLPLRSPDGELVGTVTVATDMTELKRLEREKDDFLSVAAHELRTPLTPMTMLLQSLERKARSGIVDLDAIVRTRRQLVRLTKLISDLLDVSRVHESALNLRRAPLELGQLVSEVVDTFRSTAQKHTVTLDLRDAPFFVNGDKLRLEQVIVNLLDNAVKYSPEGGPVHVIAERRAPFVAISVADRGIGIPTDQQSRLFERFFRAENASNRKFQGFGLGLYLAHAIAEGHDGSLSVASQLGQGSRFTVSIPLLAEDSLESLRSRPKPAPRVLLVDDDPDILHVAGDILEEEGYEILRAHNGAEALRHLEAAPTDLVLLDLMMPVKDGWEVLTQLRSSDRWSHVPVVVLSAHDAGARHAANLKADAFLGKPFEVDALVRKVAEFVPIAKGERPLPPGEQR